MDNISNLILNNEQLELQGLYLKSRRFQGFISQNPHTVH